MLYTVRGLEEGVNGVEIRLRIISVDEPRKVKTKDGVEHLVVDAQVGDQTGIVSISLWDDKYRGVDVGDIIDLSRGYVNRFKGRLRLNLGLYGSYEKVEDPNFPSIERIVENQKRKRSQHIRVAR